MLGFPAVMSATVGYFTLATAGYEKRDGNFVIHQTPDLNICYNVTAGALIRYDNGILAPGPPLVELDVMNEYPWQMTQLLPRLQNNYPLFASLCNAGIPSHAKLVRLQC